MREKTIKLYQFDELSDKAKETAIKKLYGINIDYGWWEFVYEDVKEIGKLMQKYITRDLAAVERQRIRNI